MANLSLFAKAACIEDDQNKDSKGGAKSGAVLAQNEAQHTSAPESTASHELMQSVNRKGVMQDSAISCDTSHTPLMEEGGIEASVFHQ